MTRSLAGLTSGLISHRPMIGLSAALTSAKLVGFYALTDRNVPVFGHVVAAWEELVSWALGSSDLGVRRALDLFADRPVPRPTSSDVDAVVQHVRSHLVERVLTEVSYTFSVRQLAQEQRALGAMTEPDKFAWQKERYESSLGRSAYPSFQAIHEAVQHELLALSGGIKKIADPESPRTPIESSGSG